jgi:hypothetical protein
MWQFTVSPSPPTRVPAGGSIPEPPRDAGGYRAQDATRIAHGGRAARPGNTHTYGPGRNSSGPKI